MALPEAKQHALSARIAGLSFPTGGWLGAARADALARLTAMGMPTKRDEYWRYTDPSSLVSPLPDPAKVFEPGDEVPVFDTLDRLKLVFVDGVFDATASDNIDLEGVEIERLSTVALHDVHWAQNLYGVLEARGQSPVQRPLAAKPALNSRCWRTVPRQRGLPKCWRLKSRTVAGSITSAPKVGTTNAKPRLISLPAWARMRPSNPSPGRPMVA
jgi:hypothetical protein